MEGATNWADFPTFPVEHLEDGTPILRKGRQIYPGSHELRIEALIGEVNGLELEGCLVLSSLQKSGAHLGPPVRTPEETLELLCEAAFAICHQLQQSKSLLSKLGFHISPNPRLDTLCQLAQGSDLQS